APERAAQFQRWQHVRAIAREQFDVIRKIVCFIEMPADKHDRRRKLLPHGCGHRSYTAAPQPRCGDGARLLQHARKLNQFARSNKPPDGVGSGSAHSIRMIDNEMCVSTSGHASRRSLSLRSTITSSFRAESGSAGMMSESTLPSSTDMGSKSPSA